MKNTILFSIVAIITGLLVIPLLVKDKTAPKLPMNKVSTQQPLKYISLGDSYTFGSNTVDFKAQEAVTRNNNRIQLSKKEAMLLKLLFENKNEVVTREKILQAVWGYNVYPTTRTIDNFILNFRKYFEEDSRNPKYFHSVRGVGYKYSE